MRDTHKGMKKVSATHHLLKRGGAWYYHRRVPKTVQSVVGIKVLHFSLGPSKTIAIRKRELLDVEWRRRFDEAEDAQRPSAGQAVEASAKPRITLTEAEAVQRVRAYVDREDERRRKGDLTADPLDPDERLEWEKELEIDLAIARGRDGIYDPDANLSREWERIFPGTEVAVDEQTFPAAAVSELVKRAAIELVRRALARARDDYRHSHFDRLFDPKRPPAVTVRDLAEQFLALKGEEAKALKVAEKTLDKQHANLALVREILGNETLVVISIGTPAAASAASWRRCRRTGPRFIRVSPSTRRSPGPSKRRERRFPRSRSSSI